MAEIKAVIFDFAGVLTTNRCWPGLAEKLSKKLSIDKTLIQERLYSKEDPLLLGNQTTKDFWEKNMKDIKIPLDAFLEEFASWYELNQETLDLAKFLKKSFKVVIFSDNFDAATPSIRKDPALKGIFEEMFFSNEMHLMKPQEESFKQVLKELGLNPEECVFIDDKEKNMLHPKNLGIHPIVFKSIGQVKQELEALGIKTK